jgi:inositol transporter-like SP family MFS transporter
VGKSESFALERATAQGTAFAVVRIGLGLWSFFVPYLTATGFTTLAWILTGFLLVSGVVGFIWAPRHEGKTLEEIQRERSGRPRGGLHRQAFDGLRLSRLCRRS